MFWLPWKHFDHPSDVTNKFWPKLVLRDIPFWKCRFGWLCWGLTSQSTIFQSCRDGAIASWVINQYFRGVKCLAQGHNTAAVGFEPRTSRSGVRHSTTEPPRSPESVENVRRQRTDDGPLLYYIFTIYKLTFRLKWDKKWAWWEWRTLENCQRVMTNHMKFQKQCKNHMTGM